MNPLAMKDLNTAEIMVKAGQPFSSVFQDIYYNLQGGLEEAEHVFIQGNDLLDQWHKNHQMHSFCIGETGFGSGLNFLLTCLKWAHCESKPGHLHFISTELFPMAISDMQKAHAQFPAIQAYSHSLLKQCESRRAGFHRIEFAENITLTLLLGEASQSLKQLYAEVDVWYLDGFAPSKNPEMWSAKLFAQIARLSKPGATVATFSAAAVVKKGLEKSGFEWQKKSGFGRKRDMLVGRLSHATKPAKIKQPWHPLPRSTSQQNTVTIIGGGIAGLALAKSFHQAGYQTTLIDYHQHPLQQASGNGYAMVMPLITGKASPESLFYLRAFEYAQRIYSQTSVFNATGVTEYLNTTAAHKRAKNIKDLGLSKQLLTVKQDCLEYPNAGFVDGEALAKLWQPYIDHWLQAEVTEIKRNADNWHIYDADAKLVHQCETLIIAAGMNTEVLLKAQKLPLTAKLGQTHQLKLEKSLNIKQIQLNQGYLIPVDESVGHYLLGATFDHYQSTNYLSHEFNGINHLSRNLAHWNKQPFNAELQQAKPSSSHTALRATTPDHLPICGPVTDRQQFEIDYQDLHHGRHWKQYPEAKTIQNLYVMTGLGSRGFTSAPLLADYLMSMITGQPLPLEVDLCKIIHPNRFNYRQLKKSNIP